MRAAVFTVRFVASVPALVTWVCKNPKSASYRFGKSVADTCGLKLDRDVNAARNLAALARTTLRTAEPGAPPGLVAAHLVVAA